MSTINHYFSSSTFIPESAGVFHGVAQFPSPSRKPCFFPVRGLSHQGPTGNLGVSPPIPCRTPGNSPQHPWNDCRCCVRLPSECQAGRGKKPTAENPAVQPVGALRQSCLEGEQPGDSLKPLGSCPGPGLWEHRLGLLSAFCPLLPLLLCSSSVRDILGKRPVWG